MMFLNAVPLYDGIRTHPIFISLLERMNFPGH